MPVKDTILKAIETLDKKLTGAIAKVDAIADELEALKEYAALLPDEAGDPVPVMPSISRRSPAADRKIVVQPYLDALALLCVALDEQRAIKGKKMRPYSDSVGSFRSDGGNFERHAVQLIAKGMDIGKALDERRAELRSWIDGTCDWRPDTDAGQVAKVNEVIAHLRKEPIGQPT